MERSVKVKSDEDIPPPMQSPASGFVWAGLLCLIVTGIVGVRAILQAAQHQSDAPLGNLFYALLLLLCSVPLFYAQVRYLFWRRASGVLLMHFSPNADPVAMKKKAVPAESAERWLIPLGLLVLALVPRWLALQAPAFPAELPLIHAIQNGHALPEQNLYGYFPLSHWIVMQLKAQGFAGDSGVLPMALLRLPAFVCGVGVVPLVYVTVKLLLDRPIALASALMLALSPITVAMSGRGQSFAVLLFFAVAQCCFLARAVRDCEANMWLGWLACVILGTLFAPTFWMLVAIDAVYLMIRAWWVSSRMRLRAQGAALLEQVLVLGAAYAVFVSVIYIFIGWRFAVPVVEFPLLFAPNPFTTTWDTVLGLSVSIIGFVALCGRPSAIPVYAGLIFALGFGIAASSLVSPLLFVLMAAGVAWCVNAVMGSSEAKAPARETVLYVVTSLWIVLNLPSLRNAVNPPQAKPKPAAAFKAHSHSEIRREQ